MKTVSVRIKASQAERLQTLIPCIPGGSLNAITQRAIDLFLDIEGPVYEALGEAQAKRKRQDVSPIH